MIQILNTYKANKTSDLIVPEQVPKTVSRQSVQKAEETIESAFQSRGHLLKYIPWALVPFVLILIFAVDFLSDFQDKHSEKTITVVAYSPSPSPSQSIHTNNISVNNENTAKEKEVTITETATPLQSSQKDPINCVRQYYDSINLKNYHAAYDLESERSRIKTSYNEWYQNIWSNNVAINLRKQELKFSNDSEAEVFVELISTDKVKDTGKELQAVYSGAVKLIMNDGKWWIDGFSITPKKES